MERPAGKLEYRVVETSTVTEEELTAMLNREAREGWNFEGFHFAMREASRRPAMAFVLFTRAAGGDTDAG